MRLVQDCPMKKAHIKNILVPVDFSSLSINALRVAQRFARQFGATVHLANVQVYSYPAGSFAPLAPIPVSPFLGLENRRLGAETALRKLAKLHGVTGTCRAEIGASPFDTLCWLARKISADLIITATHGRTGLSHLFLGSTAERLVQHSSCPILVVRASGESKTGKDLGRALRLGRILVPIDFSADSFKGLKYAIAFAKKFGAEILVLHAIDAGYAYAYEGIAVHDLSIYEEEMLKEARHDMAAFVGAANFEGVPYQTAVRIGKPAECICDYAEKEQANLIITSTHGYTGLKHVLVGSVAERVVRLARTPVLVVPAYPTVRSRQTRGKQKLPSVPMWKPRSNGHLTKKEQKIAAHAFPERRRINKFRESHRELASAR